MASDEDSGHSVSNSEDDSDYVDSEAETVVVSPDKKDRKKRGVTHKRAQLSSRSECIKKRKLDNEKER